MRVHEELPICDVCGCAVESLTREDDALRGEIMFTARCHGAWETTVLTHRDIAAASVITIGRAFVLQALEAGDA